ncbi:CTA8 [[Candida] subhashii]|uniref:Heat shock transcription factor n=1 Tax=[Candida] subhashii TaxID=561895 RepID=A0A8J5Q5Z6_9ASCO|nr:CTA8 [[Candida] subhashii]KAG7661994.1 CTA8 [[Candida] subhashii]
MADYMDGDDPIAELLSTEPHQEDNDIQTIERNTSSSNNSNQNNLSLTPFLGHAELPPNIDNQTDPHQQHHEQDNEDTHRKSSIEQPTGHTPLFIPEDLATPHNHQELISHDFHNSLFDSKYQHQDNLDSNHRQLQQQLQLPRMKPLSESVIPKNIGYPQSTIDDLKQLILAQNQIRQQQQQIQEAQSRLLQPAPKRRKESSTPKTRPAFVMKIWSMVNDPANQEYIRWNDDGKTFQVFHREEFMKSILPKYFKHNNFASFVRQLNMYGWHKVQDIRNGSLESGVAEGKDKDKVDEFWQFENPNFLRGREDLLDKIVRNTTKTLKEEGVNEGGITGTGSAHTDSTNITLALILKELENIKMNQYAITEDLNRVRKDNKTLWQEHYVTRERNQTQARALDNILKFLAAMYGNTTTGKILEVDSSHLGDMNNMMTEYRPQLSPRIPTRNPVPSSNIHLGHSDNNVYPQYRPRLMLTEEAHRPSTSGNITRTNSTPGSIEEIIRTYDHDKASQNNVNRVFQQLIQKDNAPSPRSPRHLYSDLATPPPLPIDSRRETDVTKSEDPELEELLDDLDQSIYKQGQSIQHVQDWIEKLAEQNGEHPAESDTVAHNADDVHEFDVNEFLAAETPVASGASAPTNNATSPVVVTPGSNATSPNEANPKKRSIQEVYEGNEI